MSGWLARSVAVSVLTAVLACSSLGTCWQTFVPRGHSCCEPKGTASIGSVSSCASLAVRGAVPHPAPVVALAISDATLPLPTMRGARDAAFFALLPARTPPLVLRI